MKTTGCLLAVVMTLFAAAFCGGPSRVKLECETFRYTIGDDGVNIDFVDKATNTDYLDRTRPSPCARVTVGNSTSNVTAASLRQGLLTLDFGGSGVKAPVRIVTRRRHIAFEVVSVEGSAVSSLEFLNIPLTLKGKPSEPFGACSFALNTFTHIHQWPALQSHLWAAGHAKFGLTGAKAALVGVPTGKMLAELKAVVGGSKDLPHVKVAGAWAQETAFCHGSYLFNFGSLTEGNVDEWIAMVQRLGFNQIDNHGGGSDFFRFGDFHLNEEKWPAGWGTYKRIVARLHEAGIGSILHTYAFFVDKQSKYVTPVPHPQLDAFRSFTLAGPVDTDDTEITVVESTADVSPITGFFERNSVTLHIGDELVTFTGATKEPPYTFTGCRRGAHGTVASSHAAGGQARHLKECFGLFVPDCESELFEEIARNHAAVVDSCGFDGFYLDAIDGSDILRGGDEAWYWGQRFVFLIYKYLRKPVSMEMSAMWHQMWNFRSRWQAWDYPNRGQKRFIDIHAQAVNSGLLLPMHLGWWNFQRFSPPQVDPSYTEVIEFLGCKLIGFNAGLSLTGAVNSQSLKDIPAYRRLVDLLRTYEGLRHSGYFDESVKARLREPAKEFTLFKDEAGSWRFKPTSYERHKVTGPHDGSAEWQVNSIFAAQPVKLKIETLMSAGPFDASGNVTLADFAGNDGRLERRTAAGVAFEIAPSDEQPGTGLAVARFTASNTGKVDRAASWATVKKTFDPWLNLTGREALGVWINGDGNGEVINFRLESPDHLAYGAVADRYVTVDFTGWRYVEMLETESERWSDYTWDDGKSLYNAYRETIRFDAVESVSVWLNNLPAGKDVACEIGPVRAIQMKPSTMADPTVTIKGTTIVFPVSMTSGDYLEFLSMEDCTLYGPKGEVKARVIPRGDIPPLANGINILSFACTPKTSLTPRVQVTVIGYGEPL